MLIQHFPTPNHTEFPPAVSTELSRGISRGARAEAGLREHNVDYAETGG